MSEKPKMLDIFSGLGAFSIAGERRGFETIGFSEIEPYACKILEKHWPGVRNYGNIKNITKSSFRTGGIQGSLSETIDLVTGGFPCQPFSVAGKKRGDSDSRHLWPELVRVIGEIRPTFFLGENVPGLLSISGGRVFNGILSDLCKIGYDCIWNLVPASAVGANHQRDRLWIVAHSKGARTLREPKIICEQNGGSYRELSGQSVVSSHVADTSTGNSNRRATEPGMGRIDDEYSEGLDRNPWGEGWEDGTPRTVSGMKNRADRLRCLGNSVVPKCAEIFLKEIRKLL